MIDSDFLLVEMRQLNCRKIRDSGWPSPDFNMNQRSPLEINPLSPKKGVWSQNCHSVGISLFFVEFSAEEIFAIPSTGETPLDES
jgi:hypothetical protein